MAHIKLTIDGKTVSVEPGTTVLRAAEEAGIKIPHYCYHPGLSLAGNCRMCLVEVEKAPKPMASCMAPVAEGMVVNTKSESVVSIRKSVMEFLLINHPLDCPTCDQAGECRLQDYYMDYDRIPSRFREDKVDKNKMVDLGASVMLDQERCIACTRCIRVCKEIGKVDELTLANRGDHVTITTFPGKKLSNPYAGNVVDVCPVGALTSKEFRFQKRVWFLEKSHSVCTGCSRGCNITVEQEESKVYRLLPRYNPQVNQYWMCDEGRHGYHFINENRVLTASIRDGEIPRYVGFEEAIQLVAQKIKTYPLNQIAVVAHAGETVESLEVLKKLATEKLKSNLLFFSRNDPVNPSHDDFLITADKNPNQAALNQLGFKPLSELKDAAAVIVLRGLKDSEWKFFAERKIPILALLALNDSVWNSQAFAVLPIPSFVEQDGHFINVQGFKQKVSQAFEPRGESRLVTEWFSDLSILL